MAPAADGNDVIVVVRSARGAKAKVMGSDIAAVADGTGATMPIANIDAAICDVGTEEMLPGSPERRT
jgi:hypothetical protein